MTKTEILKIIEELRASIQVLHARIETISERLNLICRDFYK